MVFGIINVIVVNNGKLKLNLDVTIIVMQDMVILPDANDVYIQLIIMIKDNTQLVCDIVNRMKLDLPMNEFVILCKIIYDEQNRT